MQITKFTSLVVLFLLLSLTTNFARASFEKTLAYGMKLEKAEKFEQAIKYYHKICDQNPSVQIYSRLVSLLGKLRKYDKALPILDEALTKFPGDVGLLNLQGLIAMRRNETARAKKSWLKVLEIEPENEFAKKNLAKIKTPVEDKKIE